MTKLLVTQGKIASGAEKVTSILYEDMKDDLIVLSGTKPQLEYFSNCGFVVEKVDGLQALNRDSFKFNKLIKVMKSFIPLRKSLLKHWPEYIHVYNLPSLLYTSISLMGKAKNFPIVLHVHDYYSKDKLLKLFSVFLRRKPYKIIAVSNSVKRDLISLKFPETKICVVHNGIVDKQQYQNKNYIVNSESTNELNVIFIGSIAKWKGLHILLKAAEILKYQSNIQVNFNIAGPFLDKEYEKEIRILSEKVPYQVSFLGKVENPEELMNKMDILVHCSIEKDPFPTVVLEGLAAGIAVIASSAGGAKEVIKEMDTGLLHAPGNYKELAKKLQTLIDNPGLRSQISRNGYSYALEFLNKDRYKKNFFGAITNLT
ncbi:glycosyltransferase family 4 protein [Heyndrickxia coagulans]|uniref:glycosyltransferase family 4 protein n=1 Tax=Heyndrickxia coagulans TaxID=1398 RepID=UPI002E239A7C|nr:glycosyltransferase family 4 protein [Heyndrickxia coagulans]